MKAPFNWIKDYVDIDVDARTLAEKMVMTGSGVEETRQLGQDMTKVVVGRVTAIEKHPDADKLFVCQVDVGDKTVRIVTGADNVFAGAFVPVALDGSHLPVGINIKTGKLRGVESQGMLCSGEELCIKESDYTGAESHGILILNGDFAPGIDMRDVLGLDDTIIDFEIGANRPDCLSIIGIAREAALSIDKPIKLPEPSFEQNDENISDYLSVEVKSEFCSRYMARVIKNVKIAQSPDWLKKRLSAAGVRSINNIVDISNFVMLESGQPMHAFDAADIRGKKIVVRTATPGEKLTTLDDKEREMTTSTLLICDSVGPIGIAGVMGGQNSEIKSSTTTIVFESATFLYGNIRQTARSLGLSTEASMRFSKGVDPSTASFALHRACQLVQMLGAGEIVGGEIDVCSADLSPKTVTTTATKVNALLGTDIPIAQMANYLSRAHFDVDIVGDEIIASVPPFRSDVDQGADLAEEVARIYGYDNIPEKSGAGELGKSGVFTFDEYCDSLIFFMTAMGFYECRTFSFTGIDNYKKLGLSENDELYRAIKIINPLGDDTAFMRTQLAGGLLNTLAFNENRKNKNVRIFEIGKVFLPETLPLTELPDEQMHLGFCAAGGDFFQVKGFVETLLDMIQVENAKFTAESLPYLHPGVSAKVTVDELLLGYFGKIHPGVAEAFGISERTFYCEFNIGALLEKSKTAVAFVPLPKFPAIERDIAVVSGSDIAAGDLEAEIIKSGGKYLVETKLFDVYQGAEFGRSLAWSLKFRSDEKTLTDDEISGDIDNILKILFDKFGAELRK